MSHASLATNNLAFTDHDGATALVNIYPSSPDSGAATLNGIGGGSVLLDLDDVVALFSHVGTCVGQAYDVDVREETGVETYVNDAPDDSNPGIIVDSMENRGRALTSTQARALAAELLSRADYLDTL